MLSSRRKSETGLKHIIRPLQGYQVSKSSIRSMGGKQSGRIMGIAESEEKQIGGGVGVPDHLGQTNYAEICILVTRYIS